MQLECSSLVPLHVSAMTCALTRVHSNEQGSATSNVLIDGAAIMARALALPRLFVAPGQEWSRLERTATGFFEDNVEHSNIECGCVQLVDERPEPDNQQQLELSALQAVANHHNFHVLCRRQGC